VGELIEGVGDGGGDGMAAISVYSFRAAWRNRGSVRMRRSAAPIAVHPAEVDQLRRAMGAKRSVTKMAKLQARFFVGAAANGVTGDLAERIFHQIHAFSGIKPTP
jgi:hypothetical protein